MLWGRGPWPPRRAPLRRGRPPQAKLADVNERTVGEHTVDVEAAAAMIEAGEATLVDVRQDYEWEAGRIPGATHIPLDSLPGRAAEIDRSRPVIFQCRSGPRSAMATEAFRASGVEAYNLVGGIEAWVERGLEIEPPDGEVAKPQPDNS
jgi:rhodanese-related sulfurtransferase